MEGDVTAALKGAAQTLHDSLRDTARAKKQMEFRSRREARDLMRKADLLRVECARYGINLIVDTASEEAQS